MCVVAVGDLEKSHGVDIGPCNDRDNVDIAASQVYFYKTFGDPLFVALANLLPDLAQRLQQLRYGTERTNISTQQTEKEGYKHNNRTQQQQQPHGKRSHRGTEITCNI